MEIKGKKKRGIMRRNSMVVQIMLIVIVGILLICLAVAAILINMSKRTFVSVYGDSQEKVFYRIEYELNEYHENLQKLFTEVNSSWNLKLYLQEEYETPQDGFQAAYNAEHDMQRAIPSNMDNISVMTISLNERSYLSQEETITTPVEEILASPEAQYALENPGEVQYVYLENGYTSTTRNSPVIMTVKALGVTGNQNPYGVIFVTMKEEDFRQYYEYFTSEYADFYLVDQNGRVISTSERALLGQRMPEKEAETLLVQELPYYHCTAFATIDTTTALGNLYNEPELWLIALGILLAALILIFIILKRTTGSLSKLVGKMSNARKTQYGEYIELGGSQEIEELSFTYNEMLDELNGYISELIETQKEKRKAEIAALQMQINPHYVYNTLASIKWLVFQGNAEKSAKTIDAFIALLRSTIGDADEYITIRREIENLKNYVLINNTRYGDRIRVEYQVDSGCENSMIPKMILQPFVENAFFHAFPFDADGSIKISVRKQGERLEIRIADNGVGMSDDRLRDMRGGRKDREHFNGIGVRNVDDRLKLLYGGDYDLKIESEESKGTTVIVLIPNRQESTADIELPQRNL